jgi:hypothetical protein
MKGEPRSRLPLQRASGCTGGRTTWRVARPIICWLALVHAPIAFADDDDAPADAAQARSEVALSAEQRRAVGIELAHPVTARMTQTLDALGQVLDTESLVADAGELLATTAAARAAQAETARLERLYHSDAGASQKMVEAAGSEQAKAEALRQLAGARFAQHWAPLQKMPTSQRQQLVEAVASGATLLLRATVSGRHSLAVTPTQARVDVDGLQVAARVLGMLSQSDATQGVGVLLAIAHPPAGLGAGAHLPVTLETTPRAGLLLPRTAVLYDEQGAYVFKQLSAKPGEKLRYVRVNVRLLLADHNGWLVHGVDDDDDIVVAGAGVLWSLAGMRGVVVDDDD